jgi:hypothetical protein
LLGSYEKTSYCLYYNKKETKKGKETETGKATLLQLIVGRSTGIMFEMIVKRKMNFLIKEIHFLNIQYMDKWNSSKSRKRKNKITD